MRSEAKNIYSDKNFVFARKLRLNILIHEKKMNDTIMLMNNVRLMARKYAQSIVLNQDKIKKNPSGYENLIYLYLLTVDLPLTTNENEVIEKACKHLGKEECDEILKEQNLQRQL